MIENWGQVLTGEITDQASIKTAVEGSRPDMVYHLASTAFNASLPAEMHLQVIVLGTFRLLEVLREFSGVRVVFTGSAAEYGSGDALREDHPLAPTTLLGACKASASIMIQAYSRLHELPAVILRLFTPYGPWEHPRRIVPHTVLSAMDGQNVPMTKGAQQRDFVYIDDVVDALLLAADRDLQPGSIFNIGSGVGTPVREIVHRLLKKMGDPVKALVGAVPSRSDEILEMSADISLARRSLGWEPKVSLDEGLRKSIAWVTENRELLEMA